MMMSKEKINIILVDDSKAFLEALQVVLKKCTNCNVIDICYNGKELVGCESLPKADLIISDIEMPEMNGIEAAKRVNYSYPQLPMLALTMHIEGVFLEDIVMAGFRGFVYKPEVSIKLNDVINKVLNKQFVFPDYLIIKKQNKNGGLL